ncbi:hypothetical protein ACFQ0M_01335 [Kitasatospora aburaviensis]
MTALTVNPCCPSAAYTRSALDRINSTVASPRCCLGDILGPPIDHRRGRHPTADSARVEQN